MKRRVPKQWESVVEANRLYLLDSCFCVAVYYLPGPSECERPRHIPYFVADWDERRGLPTEDDRVAVADGTMVDRSARESVSVRGWAPPPALRSGGPRRGGRGNGPEISFTPRRLGLVPGGPFCLEHGPAPTVWLVASNAPPPYVWTECGVDTLSDLPSYSPTRAFGDGHYEVSARWRDDHSALVVSDTIRFDPSNCRPGRTNFLGAAWTSTHNPTNAADHAPGIEPVDRRFGPLCPVAHDVDVKLGWTHNTAILWIRNLVRIVTGDPMDDETDHCIARDWKENDIIDLWKFVDVKHFHIRTCWKSSLTDESDTGSFAWERSRNSFTRTFITWNCE